jgi:hypothetical protein
MNNKILVLEHVWTKDLHDSLGWWARPCLTQCTPLSETACWQFISPPPVLSKPPLLANWTVLHWLLIHELALELISALAVAEFFRKADRPCAIFGEQEVSAGCSKLCLACYSKSLFWPSLHAGLVTSGRSPRLLYFSSSPTSWDGCRFQSIICYCFIILVIWS